MSTFFRFFFLQVLAYSVVDASNRFVAQGNIPLSVSSGMLYAGIAFFVIRRVGEATSGSAIYGYILGGGVGTWLGIIVSRGITGL